MLCMLDVISKGNRPLLCYHPDFNLSAFQQYDHFDVTGVWKHIHRLEFLNGEA